jgi:hypothetical protein
MGRLQSREHEEVITATRDTRKGRAHLFFFRGLGSDQPLKNGFLDFKIGRYQAIRRMSGTGIRDVNACVL